MTFDGPSEVFEGQTFHIDVFAINRSTKKRRLAIVAVPLTGRPPRNKRQSEIPSDRHGRAQVILDDRTVQRLLQGNSSSNSLADFIALDADVKIGPLLPGACHNTQLEFLALSPGLVKFELMSIVDVETREIVYVTDLPHTVVIEKAGDNKD